MSDAVLVSGDEDLRVGVQQAQEFGVRVHLIGIKPSRGSQSLFLLQEADTTHEWSVEEVSRFLECKPRAAPPEGVAPTIIAEPGDTPLDSLVPRVAARLDRAEIDAVIEAFGATNQLPRDLDRQLLSGGRSAIGRTSRRWRRNTFGCSLSRPVGNDCQSERRDQPNSNYERAGGRHTAWTGAPSERRQTSRLSTIPIAKSAKPVQSHGGV